jgi:hypothetical protein
MDYLLAVVGLGVFAQILSQLGASYQLRHNEEKQLFLNEKVMQNHRDGYRPEPCKNSPSSYRCLCFGIRRDVDKNKSNQSKDY